MMIWVDAHLSPSLAAWITETFAIPAKAVRDLGLRDAQDWPIFLAARKANAIVLTKDADFPQLLSQHGPPPKVLWLTCGNTSNESVRGILSAHLARALDLFESGEAMVEITGPASSS